MKWHPFEHDDQVFDLSHLHDLEFDLIQPATQGKPERSYPVTVEFSLHCFAKTREPGDDIALVYADNRETRTFCFERYALSKQLRDVFQTINERTCYHTGHGNFMTIELTDIDGARAEYEVYFEASKMAGRKPKRLKLYVQSAYVRDPASRAYRPRSRKMRKISIFVIAHNTLHGKPIRK